MKKMRWLVVVSVAMLPLGLLSCVEEGNADSDQEGLSQKQRPASGAVNKPPGPRSPRQTPRSAGLDIERPELEKAEAEKESAGGRMVYAQTVLKRPPFYKGEMPLTYKQHKRMMGQNMSYIVLEEFEDWTVLYVYNSDNPSLKYSGVASGAKVIIEIGGENLLVAEAKLSELIKGGGVEIEEFHYGPEGIIFYCKSTYDFGLGWKKTEEEVQGRKQNEYFLFWPTSSH